MQPLISWFHNFYWTPKYLWKTLYIYIYTQYYICIYTILYIWKILLKKVTGWFCFEPTSIWKSTKYIIFFRDWWIHCWAFIYFTHYIHNPTNLYIAFKKSITSWNCQSYVHTKQIYTNLSCLRTIGKLW